jgi:hypothetical protein
VTETLPCNISVILIKIKEEWIYLLYLRPFLTPDTFPSLQAAYMADVAVSESELPKNT